MSDYRPDYLVLHHSAGSETLSELVALHYYHICVEDLGRGQVPFEVSVPADRPSSWAVGGFNSRSFSICVAGNYNYKKVSPELFKKLEQICVAKCLHFRIPALNIVSHGYCGRYLVDFNQRYSTECCGLNLDAAIPALRKSVRKYLPAVLY